MVHGKLGLEPESQAVDTGEADATSAHPVVRFSAARKGVRSRPH